MPESENEFTLLLWEPGNEFYPEGHAAVRLRKQGEVQYFNYEYVGEGPQRMRPSDFQRKVPRTGPFLDETYFKLRDEMFQEDQRRYQDWKQQYENDLITWEQRIKPMS